MQECRLASGEPSIESRTMRFSNEAMIARSAVAALLCWLVPAPGRAQPLDLADSTPRTIQVEFEISVDPATAGQAYSTPIDATYSAAGKLGTVSISGADYESLIQTHELDYFDALMSWSLIAGSASDFILHIDLTTLEASAEPFGYQVSIQSPVQQVGNVGRDLSTTAAAGFAFLPEFPGFPFFCGFCVPVAGAPYDPITGAIHAVGSDHLVAPDIDLLGFSKAGELRLSERPAQAVPALSSYGLCGLAIALASLAFRTLRRERTATERPFAAEPEGIPIGLW
jgi:hypothetical protein